MHILEETDEYLFVQKAVKLLGVDNQRPDLAPGGVWRTGDIMLTWGARSATEPPTIQLFGNTHLLNGPAPLPREMEARLLTWRTAWRNRKSQPQLASLDFRTVIQITAILGIEDEGEEQP